MRHLLTAILVVVLLSVAFMVFANNRCDSEKDGQTDSQCLAESVSDEQSRYYGDTLYQFDGKTVVYDYSSGDDAEVSSLSLSALVTYKDTVPVDTCWIIGNGTYVADGSILRGCLITNVKTRQ